MIYPTSFDGQETNSLIDLSQPIQRICKYPLLFSDLLRYTPVIDCPESHGTVDKTLHRLRETAEEINKATTDEYAREKIEKSWRLQDMLQFPKQVCLLTIERVLCAANSRFRSRSSSHYVRSVVLSFVVASLSPTSHLLKLQGTTCFVPCLDLTLYLPYRVPDPMEDWHSPSRLAFRFLISSLRMRTTNKVRARMI